MATESVKTIKASGGDYTSLSAWEAAQNADLVSLDRIAVAECYAFVDTTPCLINGWTTDATRYIEIRAAVGQENKGIKDQGYVLRSSSARAILNYQAHVRFKDIQLEGVGANVSPLQEVSTAGSPDIRLERCYLKCGAASAVYVSAAAASTGYLRFLNCVVNSGSYSIDLLSSSNKTLLVYGCTINSRSTIRATNAAIYKNTIIDCADSFLCYAPYTLQAVNCALKENNSTDWNSGSDIGNRVNQTFTYADSANGDFHLSPGDAGAKGYGTDLSGDSLYPYTIDIDGQTITTWSIGADAQVGAAGTTGTLAVTLGAVALSATGLPVASGTLAATLGVVAVSAAGSPTASGGLSATLGAETLSADGVPVVAGSAAITLGPAVLSGVGTGPIIGTLEKTLGAATLSAVAGLTVVGALSKTLGNCAAQATALVLDPITGTLSKNLGDVTVQSIGLVLDPITGTLSAVLGSVVLTASGMVFVPTQPPDISKILFDNGEAYMAFKQNIKIEQGASLSLLISCQDINGNPIPLTGCTALAEVRYAYTDVSPCATFSTVIDQPNGTVTLTLGASDTTSLTGAAGVWDCKLTWPSGIAQRLVQGRVGVSPGVSK